MSHTHYPLNTKHYLKLRGIVVYRHMLGKVQELHLM